MDRSDLLELERNSDIEDFQSGDTVRVHVKVVEGERERTQVFEGVVIRRKKKGSSSNFTVRRVTQGIGVERTFLYHSPPRRQGGSRPPRTRPPLAPLLPARPFRPRRAHPPAPAQRQARDPLLLAGPLFDGFDDRGHPLHRDHADRRVLGDLPIRRPRRPQLRRNQHRAVRVQRALGRARLSPRWPTPTRCRAGSAAGDP